MICLHGCYRGVGKDQPDIYLMAQEYLAVNADELWVFEDSLVAIYDSNNFGQAEMQAVATRYIDKGGSLAELF